MKPPVADKTDKPAAERIAPKVFDISHPGKTSAGSSARPVIVTNRPILQDPMVSKPEAEPLPSAPKLSPVESKITIKPLDDEGDVVHVDAKVEKTEKSAKNGDKTIAELAAEAIAGKAASRAAKEAESEDTAAAKNSQDGESAADAANEASSEPKTEPAAAGKVKTDGSSASDEDPEGLTVEETKEAKETAELEAEAKKQEAIDALVESRTYFLPINSVERHRSKVVSILGLLLIVALGLVLFDLLLDVGLVRINGVHAVTHFFSV